MGQQGALMTITATFYIQIIIAVSSVSESLEIEFMISSV